MNPAPATPPAFIPATLTHQQAAATPWQALVVGAGPAGAAAAYRLAARGVRTLLVDRGVLPRWKVCGCCLSPAAVGELRRLECPPTEPAHLPLGVIPLNAVRVCHEGRSVLLPMTGGGIASREHLDTALVRHAISAGTHWLPSTQVMSIADARRDGPGPVTLAVRSVADAASQPVMITADVVVLATGLADSVRVDADVASPEQAAATETAEDSRIGLGATLEPTALDLADGQLIMAVAREGYCGLVRLEDGRIDLAAAVDRRALGQHASPAQAMLAILSRALDGCAASPPFTDAIMTASFRATPALTRQASLLAGASGRILRIGDAAGYVEPFTGEGIGWALAAGRLVTESLLDPAAGSAGSLRRPAEAASRYLAEHRRHFRPLHARCRRVSLALRRPALVLAAVQAARVAPWAASRLVPVLIGAGRAEHGAS